MTTKTENNNYVLERDYKSLNSELNDIMFGNEMMVLYRNKKDNKIDWDLSFTINKIYGISIDISGIDKCEDQNKVINGFFVSELKELMRKLNK